MLTFEEFQGYVTDHIRELLPKEFENASAEINTVIKNNGIELKGLIVRKEGTEVAPNIYLEGMYADYESGKKTLPETMEDLSQVIVKNQGEGIADIAKEFVNFDSIKDRIIMTLVNAQKNEKLLADTPHTNKEDLAVIYKVMVASDDMNGMATITIKEPHLKLWGKTVEDIHELAQVNSNRLLPATVKSMDDILVDLLKRDNAPEEVIEGLIGNNNKMEMMYVISNQNGLNGAASIVYSDALKQLADKLGTDLFVIPASVHECIAVSKNIADSDTLAQMVREVNETEVSAEEQLSDHVYSYNASTKELKLADISMEELQKNTENENQECVDRRRRCR